MLNGVFFRKTLWIAAAAGILAVPTERQVPRQDDSVLSARVASFQVNNANMEEALHSLRQANLNRILIGFEKVAHRPGEKGKEISLSMANATVAEILEALCQRDPDYAYESVEDALIHVYPKNGQSDPPGLLEIKVKSFSVKGKMTPAAVIARIGELAPELPLF
jgi:hypothetical protein